MKFLLATDGSEHARRAARYLASHVAEFSKPPQIFLISVHPPIPFPGAAAAVGKKAVEDYQREECEKALKVAEEEFDKAGLRYQSSWLVGEVAAEVERHAQKVGADLVVIGSHGRSAFLSMALGSNAAKILALVKLPVLIVR